MSWKLLGIVAFLASVFNPPAIQLGPGHIELLGATGWVKYVGNPVLAPPCPRWPTCEAAKEAAWDSWDTEGPSVVKVGNIYHMFYEGDRRETAGGTVTFNLGDAIGHATSTDGIHWTKDPRNPVLRGLPGTPEDEVLSPMVLYHDAKFWMFYNTPPSGRAAVYLATSDDGI